MQYMNACLIILFFFFTSAELSVRDGGTIYKIFPRKPEETDLLCKMFLGVQGYEFKVLTNFKNFPIDIKVSKKNKKAFVNLLKNLNIKYMELTNQEARKGFIKVGLKSRGFVENVTTDYFDTRKTYEEIENFLEYINAEHPNTTEILEITETHEKRTMSGIKITDRTEKEERPIIWIDAIDVEEWIGTNIALYTISQLLMKDNFNMLQNIEWYIIPVFNPDGYEYNRLTDRYWVKNRSPSLASKCGTNLNRNFGYHWNDDKTIKQNFKCTKDFAGPEPFSEAETVGIKNFITDQSLKNRIKMYISFNLYGPYIIYSYSYREDVYPRNIDDIVYLAEKARDQMYRLKKTDYEIGTWSDISKTQPKISGTSTDWMMGEVGVPLVYTIAPPGPSMNLKGDKILQTHREIFEALKVFSNYVTTVYNL